MMVRLTTSKTLFLITVSMVTAFEVSVPITENFRLKEHPTDCIAKTIDLQPPLSKEEMTEVLCEVLRRNNLTNAYIRPIISRGVGDLGLDPRKCPKPSVIVIATSWGAMYGDLYDKGLRQGLYPQEKSC
jgi:branched-subunit amino acid aminotransferase/4-amino-4-deoxychorismate lyase